MIQKLNFKSVILFTLPSMVAIVFMAFYTMVDGAFVANLINQEALSAINIVLPIIFIASALGMMISSGGNAIYAKLLGEGKNTEAREKFTFFTVTGFITGVIITIIVLVFIEPILIQLGANEEIYQYAYDYLSVYIFFTPAIMLQMILQTALITAGKPGLSLFAMLLGGFANIILDYIFIAVLSMGISGAGLATGVGNTLGALIGFLFFVTKRNIRVISFKRFSVDWRALVKMCGNGSSEMISSLSNAVVTLLFNMSILKIAGNDGVAAVTVVLYIQMFVNSIFMGYSMGISPVISYNYGEKNQEKLRKIFQISTKIIGGMSVLMLIISYIISEPITNFFLEEGGNAYNIALHGIYIFATSILFAGFNIYASAMFTAYSNGKVSAIISFVRTFLLIAISILVLPMIIGIDGIWLAVPIAELTGIGISAYFIRRYRSIYMYEKLTHEVLHV